MTTPYRDDLEATEAEYHRLTRELADLKTRESALRTEELGLEENLQALRRKLDALHRNGPAQLLESLRIAAPCKVDWDAMAGDDKQRFCKQCEKNVYNLSAMTRAEAEAFVQAQTGEACVRLYRRADDTVITADCPVGVRKRRVRRLVLAGLGGGLVAAGAALGIGVTRTQGAMARPADRVPGVNVVRQVPPEMGEMGKVVPYSAPKTPPATPSAVDPLAPAPARAGTGHAGP